MTTEMVWNNYIQLGTTAFQKGQYELAELMLKAAYKNASKEGLGYLPSVNILENLAEVFIKQGRWVKAERLLKRCKLLHDAELGSDSIHSCRLLFKLARLYSLQRRLPLAKAWLGRAISILEKNADFPQEERARQMLILVRIWHQSGFHDEALALYAQVKGLRMDMSP